MPRVNIDDVNKYSSSGRGINYFQLKKDGETASVRIMLDGIEDLNDYIYAVHRVSVPGQQYAKNVNCLREYNAPVDDCPFCRQHMPLSTRVFIPLYNEEKEQVEIWERSTAFIKKLQSICSRYKNVVSHTFDIERNGEKGDKQTTYELYETDKDDTTLDDLPEIPEILGSYMLFDKSVEDMEYYLQENDFPPEDEDAGDDEEEDEVPVRRRSRRKEEDDVEEEEAPRRRTSHGDRAERRTPARSRNKEDKF